jgi:L-lactate dehydrogenase complex protein LldG
MGAEAALGSRDEVLRRIRAAIGGSAADAAATRSEWDAVPRDYKRSATLEHEAILEMLEDRLRDYDATVVRVKAADLASEIVKILTMRGVRRIVIPRGLSGALGESLRPGFNLVEAVDEQLPPGFDLVVDEGMSSAELDGFEGVVTASTVAIAETGTIVLQNVPGQGRRAPTLIPDYHLCVVRAADVVETVPEAMARLQPTAALATTFVSGPSATADIEMTRIKGVHGPRFLDVILST